MKTFRKILSILVVACMLLGMMPMTAAFAAEVTSEYLNSKTYVYANGRHIKVKPDGIYDLYTNDLLLSITSSTISGGVFGGSKAGDVDSTKVVVANGASPLKVWGGSWDGNVAGLSQVIIEEGGSTTVVYGGSNTSGTVGSTYVEVNSNVGSITTLFGGGYKGNVTGNTKVVLNNANVAGMGGGGNSGVNVGGDVDVTINNSTITGNLYGGGGSGSTVDGSVTVKFDGATTFATDSGKIFQPMCLKAAIPGGIGVSGDVSVYIPRTFTQEQIAKIQTNSGICVFYNDGEQISGPPSVSSDIVNKNVFANGASVTAKVYEADGKTYLYNRAGTEQLLKFPIDDYKIYGGCSTQDAASTNVAIESGRVAAVYGSGLNGAVSGTAYIKIAQAATVTGSVYSNSVLGKANASVIWVPENYDMSKVLPGENTRIFIGSTEVPDTNIVIPGVVTEEDNYVFANGIPIVVKKDAVDGRTYVYDITGTNKLLATEVNAHEIFGGSSKGVVGSTYVSMESGTVSRIYGGGFTGCVTGTATISVTGGDITEVIYGGSYDGDVGSTNIYTNGPYVAKGVNAGSRNGCVLGATNVVLVDSVAKGLYAGTGGDGRGDSYPSSDVLGNATYTLDGGMAEKIYGGCKSGVVRGTSTITIIGQAMIKTGIVPQGNGGVLGGATVIVPENYIYMDKITTGEGIAVQLTEAVEAEPAPIMGDRTEEVMSTDGDSGKLVYRFINIPEPNGNLTGRPGEAFFITFPNGQNMLVDAGGNTDTCQILLYNFLDGLGITNIDYVVATHYHADHIGSIDDIFNKPNMTIGKLLTTGFKVPTSEDYNTNLNNWIIANPDKVEYLWRNQTFNIGDVQFEVLNPLESDTIKATMNGSPSTDDYNNNSIVLKMTYGEHTSIMAADMYIAAEKELLASYSTSPDKLKADLIKVPHHGDTTSSDPEFVKAVSPEIAVFTHISDTLIVNNRYKSVGADTYVTGVDGIVKLAYDGTNAAPDIITEYYIVEPTIEVTGGSDIINVDSATETVTGYTYTVHDQFGYPIANAKVNITLTDDNGNLINDPAITFENDKLTVKGKPQVPYVVVNFAYGGFKLGKRTIFKIVGTDSTYTPPIVPPITLTEPKLEIVTNTDGTTTATATVSKSSVEAALKDTAKTTFEVNVQANTTESIAKLPADSIAAMADKNVDLVIKTSTIELSIPSSIVNVAAIAKTFETTSDKINVEVKIVEVPKSKIELQEGSSLKPTDMVYKFKIMATDGVHSIAIDSFGNQEVVGTLKMPEALMGQDEARINVYRYNEATKTLELRHTKIVDGKIVFTTSSFSLYTVMLNTISFDDVKTHWAEKYVHTLAAKSIINGKGEKVFDPEGKMTRAEFTSIISRALGLAESTSSVFTDVDADAWYAKDISAAYTKGLIGGNGDGTFVPEAHISREEMAVIASRVYKYAKGAAASSMLEAAFTDAKEISDWAAADIATVYTLGLVKGSNNMFAPKSDMTRAEGATILYNLLIKLGIL